MNFIHVKIFGTRLNTDLVTSCLGMTPDFICRPGNSDENTGNKDAWMYTAEAESEALNSEVHRLISELDLRRDSVSAVAKIGEDVEMYFVIAHYVDSYQTIINIDNDDLVKLAQMGFKLIFDVMSP